MVASILSVGCEKNPKSPDQWVAEGREELLKKDYSTANRCAEQAVRLNPEMAPAWALLSESSAHHGDRDVSIDALEKFAKMDPAEAAKLGMKIGRHWMMDNHVRQATRALRIAEVANPVPPEPFRWEAQIAGVMGRPREVVRCVIELIKRNAFTRDDLIVLTSANPVTADAQRLEQIIEADPESRLEMLIYVMHALTLNRLEEAEVRLAEITEARASDMESQGLLGEIYADSRPKQFLAWQARLPAIADLDARVWLSRGKWLRQRGETNTAIRCLHEAFLLEPELLSANFLLGQMLTVEGELKLGEEFTERGKCLQNIIALSARMKDRRANDWVEPMILELQATGRLWEAWGWSRVQEPPTSPNTPAKSLASDQLLKRLSPEIPRTHPDFLPGRDFDWNRFLLPHWSDYQPSVEVAAHSHVTEVKSTIQFVDQAEQIGLDFRFVNSATSPQGRRIYETMGAGVGVLDYDQDGWPDLYFPQGSTSASDPSVGPSDAVYRNRFGERFTNVTEFAGIHETTFSQGVAAGDIDNDGFPDIYVANLGKNCLYRNNGDGTFSDATVHAGLTQSLWTVSCAIADLNGDGLPELFDVNYVQGSKLLTGACYDEHSRAGVCRPVVFDPAIDTVAINLGDGRFLEQQLECGLDLPQGMGLGLVVADFNDDGRSDIFVANDMAPNFLLINEQSGPHQQLHFRDEAFLRGVALDKNGHSQACMGVACADINRDGIPDLFITNFAREYNALYLSQAGGFYQDQIRAAGLSEASFEPLGFGTQFLDADHDGWHDLVVINGHIDEIPNEPYRMKPQFFRGNANGRFEELFADESQGVFGKKRLGRGLALLDWNHDGRIDFVATDLDDAVLLAENQTQSPGRRLRLKLVGTESNRDAIGAKVRIRICSSDERFAQLTAGDGYGSCNQKMVDVGIGRSPQVESVEITWPSGRCETATNIDVDLEWLVIEGRNAWCPLVKFPK